MLYEHKLSEENDKSMEWAFKIEQLETDIANMI
jgi:hypothetical protein